MSSTNNGVDPVDSAISLATTYFKNGQYIDAKKLFIKTLWLIKSYSKEDIMERRRQEGLIVELIPDTPLVHPRLVKILDNVAACYDKLGELDKSLTISDKMLKKEPFNLKCYIRRGKVLQKLRRDQDAYENYKMGLHKVKRASKDYKVRVSQKLIDIIVNQKNLVKQRLSRDSVIPDPITTPTSSKRRFIDPIKEHQNQEESERKRLKVDKIEVTPVTIPVADFIGTLPLEVLPLILHQVTVKDLIHLCQVSRTYKRIVMKNYTYWFKNFKLTQMTTKLFGQFQEFIRKLNSRSSFQEIPRFDSIQLSSKMASEESKLLPKFFTLLQHCQANKMILSVPSCATSNIVRCMVPDDKFCTNIQELSITASLRSDKEYEINLLNRFQRLTKLELIFDSAVVPIRDSFNNNNNNIQSINENWCPDLKHIRVICDSKKIKNFPTRSIFLVPDTKYDKLTKLCICGVTLCSDTQDFKWLMKFPSLKELWLENNHNGKLSNLLNLLKTQNVFTDGSLESLVFRENMMYPRIDLEAIPMMTRYRYRCNLMNLKTLDLMGTSISGSGLHRLVSALSPQKLKSINIGDSPYVQLQQSSNDYNPNVFSPFDFFREFDNIEELFLPQLTSLNDQSLHILSLQVGDLYNLKKLDLSLNTTLTGVSLYEFVSKLYEIRNSIPLDWLVVDGCSSISHITINSIKARGYVNRIDCVYEREVWRQFGVNSFKYK